VCGVRRNALLGRRGRPAVARALPRSLRRSDGRALDPGHGGLLRDGGRDLLPPLGRRDGASRFFYLARLRRGDVHGNDAVPRGRFSVALVARKVPGVRGPGCLQRFLPHLTGRPLRAPLDALARRFVGGVVRAQRVLQRFLPGYPGRSPVRRVRRHVGVRPDLPVRARGEPRRAPADQVGGLRFRGGDPGLRRNGGAQGSPPRGPALRGAHQHRLGRLDLRFRAPDPDLHRRRGTALAPLRHRRRHQPNAGLHNTDLRARADLLRQHRPVAGGPACPNGPGSPAGGRRIDAAHSASGSRTPRRSCPSGSS
jgi:hypothetical protein